MPNPSLGCEDCGAPATVSLASVAMSRPRAPRSQPQEHRYCRACAERHGVPKRERRVPRAEPERLDWEGLLRFYQLLETTPISDPEQRSAVREAALQFQSFMDRVPEPAPAELRLLIARLIERTA